MSTEPLRQRHGLAVSTEHYLRAILELREERGYARVVDIATRVGVTKGSVSIALGQLQEKGLVRFDQAHFPVLTAAGKRVAQDVRGRYRIVLSFLTDVLGLPAERAAAEACRWEHVISHDAADRLRDLHRLATDEGEEQPLADRLQALHRREGSKLPAAGNPADILHLTPREQAENQEADDAEK